MNLKKIDSNTPIRNFAEIYNSNNFDIITYIKSLEDKIDELTNKLNKIESVHKSKISELDSSLKIVESNSENRARMRFVDRYNSIDERVKVIEDMLEI